MNYEEISDHEINCLVDKELFLSGGGQPAMFKLDNPGDWGKLMQDNKISLTWDSLENEWYTSTGTRGQNSCHPKKPGRAVSISYLKKQEANNG